jgi:hypothetical protein
MLSVQLCWMSFMLCHIQALYAECCYAECCCVEYCYAECRSAEAGSQHANFLIDLNLNCVKRAIIIAVMET